MKYFIGVITIVLVVAAAFFFVRKPEGQNDSDDYEPKITEEQAIEIASTRFDGTEIDSVELKYAHPNANLDTGEPTHLLPEKRLSYVIKAPIKNGMIRVTVDALTGEVIACTRAIWAASESAGASSEDELLFQKIEDAGTESIWGLLGDAVDTSKASKMRYDEEIGQKYREYQLEGGGTVGINELGIVNIDSSRQDVEVQHKKDWDAVIETITQELSLEGYKVTGTENDITYRIVWEKIVDEDKTNPYDSVYALLDTRNYQLWNLRRYHMEANATEPKITPEQAEKIASSKFDGDKADSIKLTYARPNANLDHRGASKFLFESRLSYIVKGPIENGTARVTVDALTGEVIACTRAIWAASKSAGASSAE